jgi:2,5-dihydroxypyridine 5,6-dioxygenase
MHAPELPAILQGGARVLYVSNEHPEALARLVPDDKIEPLVKAHVKRLRGAKAMRVTSAAGPTFASRSKGRRAAATGATPRGRAR